MHKYIFYTNTIFKGVFILVSVNLYSTKTGEIKSFLESFFDEPVYLKDSLYWTKKYNNPIEIVDMIGSFIDNNYKYKILKTLYYQHFVRFEESQFETILLAKTINSLVK